MALKPVLVKGPLTNGVITQNLLDKNLNVGKWLLCVKQIVFGISKEEVHFSNISVSTNLISDYRDVNNQREFYNPSLAIVTLEKMEETGFAKNLDQLWFEINDPHKTIEIFFKDCFTETPLTINSNVAILLLFRKVC